MSERQEKPIFEIATGTDPGAQVCRQAVRLVAFDNRCYMRGRSKAVEALWMFVQALFMRSFIPGATFRRFVLRAFGANIGKRVVIKPGLRIKFPWRLTVADDVWIGEDVWIDNLADVRLEANCCLSQGAYLCTGSHDWTTASFDLIIKPIVVGEGAWIAAKASIGPGVEVGEGAILTIGSVATTNLTPWGIFQGVPAQFLKTRRIAQVCA